ncbi:Glycosyltransferase Gtf1 [bioreactor metagenome]|uniref:Glycosyltransferase Gtf1 n=1 Tax=bioreactor metagenome TaxID=1076179 RepID=A0A645B739_9ZZZZ|nr:glycosyltransferase [Erysipelotrichaceae bacterium]
MKKRVLFVNDEMTLGGVSRILNNLMASLDQDRYEIDLLVLHPHGDLMSEIPHGINLITSTTFFDSVDTDIRTAIRGGQFKSIIHKIVFFMNMKSGSIIKKIISERAKILTKDYDVEFAAKEGFCTIFTAFGSTPVKLNWIQTDYRENNYARRHMKLLKQALARIDMNIACSKQVAESFSEVFGVDNIKVIRNLIDEKTIRNLANQSVELNFFQNKTVNLIAVARFHPQKGLNRLIEALRYIKEFESDVRLILIGDGPLMEDLQEQVRKANLEKEVLFMGYQINPYPYVKMADLFVLSSHYEGYPTIVIESLICSTPVLAMNVAGVEDQITENYHGWIIPNRQKDLNSKLLKIVRNKENLLKQKVALSNFHYDNGAILKEICYYIDNLGEGIKNDESTE